jgi:hypothetical protein
MKLLDVSPSLTSSQRVRVWFGRYVVADYVAAAQQAEEYADAIGRRFAGLRVTVDDPANSESNDPVAAAASPRPLPSRRLWELIP